MNTLPTIEEIQAEADRLLGLKLVHWASISLTIAHGKASFWATAKIGSYDSASSDTLADLEEALRKVIEDYSPANQLKKEAAKLGYELVKKGGDQ